jgi:signal transduction histidine kinase
MGESRTRGAKKDGREHDEPCFKLAAVVKEHREEIAKTWAEMMQGLSGSTYIDLPLEEVRSLALREVEAMVESLETGSRTVLDDYLSHICPAASDAMHDVSAATEALLLCKDAALPIIRDACGSEASATWSLATCLDECLRYIVSRVAGMCTSEMCHQLHDERARVQTLLEMAQTASSTLELDEVVRRVSEEMVAVLGVDGCEFHLVDQEQRSTVFVERPSDWSSRASLSFDSYRGVFHEMLRTREPVTCYDMLSDPRFPGYRARKLGYKSALALPLMVKDKVLAVVGAHTLHDYRHFTEDEIALARGMGNVLGLVVRSAELYEGLRQEQHARGELLAKTITAQEDERKRIARELHDQTSQDLAALLLSLDTCAFGLAAGTPGSQQHLDTAKSIAGTMLENTRRLINDLRPSLLDDLGLAAAIDWYGEHRLRPMGIALDLQYDQMQGRLPGFLETALFRIMQEALTNVVKHADASRVRVTLEVDNQAAFLTVRDNGRGFQDPVTTLAPTERQGLGLRGMRERVSTLGGEMRVESAPGRGTALMVRVPLPSQEEHGA